MEGSSAQTFVNCYMAEKAGMNDIDKKAIAQKIQRITAGTPKSMHEKQMNEKRMLEIADMIKKTLEFTSEQKSQMKKEWQKCILEMKETRSLNRYWAHFDFDMFYVACELLDKPQMKEKPCGVGGKNSVLCTANYQARKYGVRAALPTFIAIQLCPQLVLFEPNFQRYKHFSNIFRSILGEYDENLQSMGLDEAYIEITDYMKDKSLIQQEEFIKSIRQKVFLQTGLTVSCGVGANKMLAKLASQEKKPNNQFILQNHPYKIIQYMKVKALRKIPGIGPVNQFYLKGLGIQTCQDILDNLDVLTICFSKLSTDFFVSAALGLGSIEHEFKERKSVGKSQTFKPTNDEIFLVERLKSLCEEVSMQLQENGYLSSNAVLSYQTMNFQKKDKTFNLSRYSDNSTLLYDSVVDYLKSVKDKKVRLIGVRCSALIKAQEHKKMQIQNYFNGNYKKGDSKQCEVIQDQTEVSTLKSFIRSDLQEKGKYMCPICNQNIECKGNITTFNRHVDQCLKRVEKASQINPKTVASEEKKQHSEENASITLRKEKKQVIDKIKLPSKQGKNNLMTFFQKK